MKASRKYEPYDVFYIFIAFRTLMVYAQVEAKSRREIFSGLMEFASRTTYTRYISGARRSNLSEEPQRV